MTWRLAVPVPREAARAGQGAWHDLWCTARAASEGNQSRLTSQLGCRHHQCVGPAMVREERVRVCVRVSVSVCERVRVRACCGGVWVAGQWPR